MMRMIVAPLLALAFALANVGPTLCAAVHAQGRAPAEHAHHGTPASHAAAPGGAWAPVPDPGHHVACPDPAHCGATLVGPAQHGAAIVVAGRQFAVPPMPLADGAPQRLPAPATPPPRA
jgi:hypothetical protein